MNKALSGAIICASFIFGSYVHAEQSASSSRPIISTYSLEAGQEMALSTYLSPMRNYGSRVALTGEWSKRLPSNPHHLSMRFTADISAAFMHPRGLTSKMTDAGIDFDWTLLYSWHPQDCISISAGGGCGLTAGALCKLSNGNNPVAAYADVHLSLAARGAYTTKIGKLPIVIIDEVMLPSASCFFSPEYAEPYYSIYLGYHKGLINSGWWGNHFSINNLLSVRLILGNRQLDAGYRFKVDSSWAHQINTQRVSHSFVIGMTLGASEKKIIRESLL